MKKAGMMVLVFALMAFTFAAPAFANIENKAEHIQVMRQAATELQDSNPDLSKKLNDFADKKEKWAEKWKDGDGEKHWEQKQKDLGKIKEASSQLQGKNDALAGDLHEIAGRWEKKLEEKKQQA